MYIKIFKNILTSKHYIIHYVPGKEINTGHTYIENEKHIALPVDEEELFNLIDAFFKAKLNEKKGNGKKG